ncbi:MFS transporter [Oceanobacillus arenosus]|uniref:MFS transporter n=1 Tax=Oceanobacillus arenosus TaxID=1229153 RepID=A0A3D8PYH1_9BACI|nr:MFS transporter [Oceanobacillus arenosus]RDW20328.1 MFS transporter [Oceanobacillus arenosus]
MNNKRFGLHYAWWIMIASAAIYAASVGIIVSCAGLLYNAVSLDLGIGIADISLYTTIMYLTITVALPFSSKILKKFDLRIILSVAGIMNALAFGLMGTYTSVYQFYISGFILGIGSTFLIYGTIPLIINNWFKVKMGTALGAAMAFMGVGGAIFAPITGNFIESFGWRPTYIFLGIIVAILILPFTIFVIREKPKDLNMQPYDSDTASNKPATVEVIGVKKKDAQKSFPFYLIIIFTGLLGLVSTVSFHVPNFVQSIGFTPTLAATVVTCVMIGQTAGKFILGWVNDKLGARWAVTSGIGGGVAGILFLLFSDNLGVFALYAGGLLFGIGFSASTILPPTVITAVFGNRDYGPIYTSIMSASTLGVALGTTLFGFIFDTTGSYYAVFIIVIIMFAVSILTSFISIDWKRKFIRAGLFK